MRSRRQDGDQAFSLLLPCLGTTENMLTAQILMALASFKISRDHGSFIELAQRGLRIWRNLGSPSGLGFSLGYLTVRLLQICEYDEIVPYCQNALTHAQKSGDLWEIAWSLYTLGDFIFRSGNTREALPSLQQSVDYFRRLGNRWALTFPLGGLESAYANLGEYDQSRQLNQEGLAICREIGDREGIIWRCGRLAEIAYVQRDSEGAKYYLRELVHLSLELQLDARIHEFSASLIINLLLEAGERTQAVELIAMLQTDLVEQADSTHHRTVVQEFKERYARHLSTLEAQLPLDVFVAARQRGETSNLRMVMAELADGFLGLHEERSQDY
jgi:tetratricopeptide (TPR) repeat protein